MSDPIDSERTFPGLAPVTAIAPAAGLIVATPCRGVCDRCATICGALVLVDQAERAEAQAAAAETAQEREALPANLLGELWAQVTHAHREIRQASNAVTRNERLMYRNGLLDAYCILISAAGERMRDAVAERLESEWEG